MKVKRYVSQEELTILALQGQINSDTCPFAVIGDEEKNPDTDPQPSPGTVMFFVGDVATPYDSESYYEVVCDLDNMQLHQGTYRVWAEDYDGNYYVSYIYCMQEASCFSYGLQDILEIRFPKHSDMALLQLCAGRGLGIWEVEKVLREEWLAENPTASPYWKKFVPAQTFSASFWGNMEELQTVHKILSKYPCSIILPY